MTDLTHYLTSTDGSHGVVVRRLGGVGGPTVNDTFRLVVPADRPQPDWLEHEVGVTAAEALAWLTEGV